jgi:hypothetical protein
VFGREPGEVHLRSHRWQASRLQRAASEGLVALADADARRAIAHRGAQHCVAGLVMGRSRPEVDVPGIPAHPEKVYSAARSIA